MSKKHRRRKQKHPFLKFLKIIVVLTSIAVIGLIYLLDVLPIKYFAITAVIILLLSLIIIKLLSSKKKSKRGFGFLLAIILLVIEAFGINYELNTLGFFKNFGFTNYKTENYNVVVWEDNYQDIKELKNKTIGHFDSKESQGLQKAIKKLNKVISYKESIYDDIVSLSLDLSKDKIDAIILEDAQLEILEEENSDLFNSLNIIYKIPVNIEVEDIKKEVNVTNNSYNIYISGIDTYGKITKVSRSDVNIIATVNPTTHKVLLTSIPRDYYVTLRKYNSKDKLTHAGIYGVETSVGTIEDLLDIKINYYLKVNFTSLIRVVDALGGIDVESNYSFTSKDGYYYKKGTNSLDGKRALSFVRERSAFEGGDRVRGQNQQIVLSAIINKAASPLIITKYNDLLAAVDGSFITNMTEEDITKIIKTQLKEKATWQIESISLDGKDAFDYTYSYRNNKLYVMYPDEETVEQAKTAINNTMKEKAS